jgi:hypothetical protein
MRFKKFNQLNEKAAKYDIFITEIDKHDVYIECETDVDKNIYDDCNIISCNVYWDFELETGKKSGIRNIIPIIHYITLSIEYLNSKDEFEPIIKDYEFNELIIETENINDIITLPYYPKEVIIKDHMKKIIVRF